jgi:hypothetical protein
MKKCKTCIYQYKSEYEKPCIIYREDCEFYEKEKEKGMTNDLINRDAVLKEINCWIGSGEYRYAMSERFLIDRIKALPPVNPQEPKTGRLYNDIYDHYLCGNCKMVVMDYDNFCPNCGARMESEVLDADSN